MIHLATERLIVRDPRPGDFDGWHRLMSDPKTMYYLQDIMTRSPEESRENLNTAIQEAESPNRTKFFFAIEEQGSGAFVGTVGYTVTDTTPVGLLVGAGYFMLPDFQGKGYMVEAFRAVLRYAFTEGGVYRVSSGCFTENTPSAKLMEKCGMIQEAQRRHFAWHGGRMKDRTEYRLLLDEYQDTQKRP